MKKVSLYFGLCLFLSCTEVIPDLTIENPKIKSLYQLKNEDYKKEFISRCRIDLMVNAETYVDSLISAEISFQLSDSIVFPLKPLKPASQGKIIVSDTNIARPIFKK